MSGKEFKLPPLSPLIGGTSKTLQQVLDGMDVDPKYSNRVFYTKALISILAPLRAYEDFKDRNLSTKSLNPPVFILGHWRSGTTHLHNLMCKDPAASYVTTYHTVFTNFLHSQGLLKPFMRLIMPGKRPSDNVKLDPNFPQEEEFALSNMTKDAFYHFFYFPTTVGNLYKRTISFDEPGTRETWITVYNKLLLKAQQNTGNGRLVIKNPVNTGRFRVLANQYPEAKFINIHRNPFIVFLSTKKFFAELFPTLWFEDIGEDFLDEMILDLYVRLNSAYFEDAESVESSRLVEVAFADFEMAPIAHLEDIYHRLDIPGFERSRPVFEEYLQSLGQYKKNSYSISKGLADKIESRWSPIYRKWGYDFPDNLVIE